MVDAMVLGQLDSLVGKQYISWKKLYSNSSECKISLDQQQLHNTSKISL